MISIWTSIFLSLINIKISYLHVVLKRTLSGPNANFLCYIQTTIILIMMKTYFTHPVLTNCYTDSSFN